MGGKLIEIQGHDIQGLSILCILLVVQLFWSQHNEAGCWYVCSQDVHKKRRNTDNKANPILFLFLKPLLFKKKKRRNISMLWDLTVTFVDTVQHFSWTHWRLHLPLCSVHCELYDVQSFPSLVQQVSNALSTSLTFNSNCQWYHHNRNLHLLLLWQSRQAVVQLLMLKHNSVPEVCSCSWTICCVFKH